MIYHKNIKGFQTLQNTCIFDIKRLLTITIKILTYHLKYIYIYLCMYTMRQTIMSKSHNRSVKLICFRPVMSPVQFALLNLKLSLTQWQIKNCLKKDIY